MKKIAVVIPKYGLVGGAEQFVSELTNKLAIERIGSFHVFANLWESADASIAFHRVPIITFPKFLTTISFAYFVRRGLAGGSFDLVHSHDRIFAADLFTLHGIPHRYWIQNIRRKKMSLYDLTTAWMERKLIKEGDCKKFIAVSDLTKRIFLQEYQMDPEKVAVIHPGVHLSDYEVDDRKSVRAGLRKAYGIPAGEPVMAFASMNFEIKGLDAIIDALGRLKAQKYIFRLIVAGKGNVRKYTNLAQKAGIDKNMIFTGVLNKKDLIRHYLASDIYIMLSAFDTFGMVVLEAMAAGLPVIISSNVGAKDVVQEGENGFVIANTGDTEYIAEKIKSLFDEKKCRKMSLAAEATAKQNTWDKTVAQYEQIYEEILDTHNR